MANMGLGTTLDQETCVGWIGGVLLESESTPKGSIVELDFLSDWKNQVPEEWRKHVAASVLKVLNPCRFSYWLSNHTLSPV